jgi:hypothetical protein
MVMSPVILTAYGILSHQLLDCWILDFTASLVYELKSLALLSISILALLYVLGRCGFSRRGQRLQFCSCMTVSLQPTLPLGGTTPHELCNQRRWLLSMVRHTPRA